MTADLLIHYMQIAAVVWIFCGISAWSFVMCLTGWTIEKDDIIALLCAIVLGPVAWMEIIIHLNSRENGK